MTVQKQSTAVPVLFAILVIALGLRFIALAGLKMTPYYSFLLPDERLYHQWALDILAGKSPATSFEYAPLPAYIMALLYKVTAVDIEIVRFFNIIFGLSGCLFIYIICRKITNQYWALLSFFLAAVSTELVLYSIVPLKTALAFLLFSAFIYIFLLVSERFTILLFFLLGGILGLLVMVRPNAVILVPFMPFLATYTYCTHWFSHQILQRFCTYSLGFFISISPFVLMNYTSSGDISFLPVQSGFLFYCINTVENPTPFYRPVPFASSLPEEQGVHFQIEASKRSGNTLTPRQAAFYWQAEIAKETINEPRKMAKKLLNKLLSLFSFTENSDHYSTFVLAETASVFTFFKVKMWFFSLLGYGGLLFSFRINRYHRSLCFIFILYLTTLLLYSNGTRFYLPLLVLLIPYTVWMVRHFTETLLARNYLCTSRILLLLGLFVFLGSLPVPGAGDLSKHYNNLAFIHKSNNELEKAFNFWQKSVNRNESYSDVAKLFLAGRDYQTGGASAAIKRLHSIPDESFMASSKYATLGDIYKHQRRLQQAVGYYQQSLSVNYSQRRVREELIEMLTTVEPSTAKKLQRDLEWVLGFYR